MCGLRLRVVCRFVCFPSCRAALSLPLARYCRRHVIAAVPSACLLRRHPFRPSSLRVMPSPPLAPPLLSRNGEGIRAGCGLFRCRRLACFPMPLPRLVRFGPIPSLPVISCGLAASHMPTEDALDAVRSLRLLPRWSVLIVF